MLFGRKKYYFSYLSAVTAFITVFYLVFGPLFLSFDSAYVPKVQAAAVTWVAGATGTWETGANWSTGVVPTSADDVTISSTTGHILVTLSSGQTANFNSLTLGGDSTYFATTTLAGNIGTGGAITVNTKGVLQQQNLVEQTITGTLTVASGGKLTHSANTTDTNTQDRSLFFSTTNFTLNSGGLIDAAEKGFARSATCAAAAQNGYGPGAGIGQTDDGSGAGHGGKGGDASKDGVSYANDPMALDYVYDSMSAPTQHGSSGGGVHFACGGAGGGSVKISITGGGTATISGTVTSTGGTGVSGSDRHPGGGSGGSVWFNFTAGGTFAGSGIISAHGGTGGGGNAFGDAGGGGGGGRIAITGSDSDTFSGTFLYHGGTGGSALNYATDGGAGTLFRKLSSATYGDLFVNNGSSPDFTPTYTSSTMTLANIWLNNKAHLVVSTSTVLTLASTTLGIATASTTLNVDGTLTTPSTFIITGKNRVYASTTQISAVTDLTIKADGLLEIDGLASSTAWSLSALTVDGELTHRSNRDVINNALNISATTITVGSSGIIHGNAKGYGGGNGDFTGAAAVYAYDGFGPGGGATGTQWGGGGGYGGHGGFGESYDGDRDPAGVGGVTYGSTSTPEYEAGSGGGGGTGASDIGGAGGGIIKLVATTLTLNGTISANGGAPGAACYGGGSAAGGGAGGGIKIEITTLAGSGSIAANGGRGGTANCEGGGGGGGGRVLVVSTNSTFSGTVTSTAGAAGNTSPASAGERGTPGSATIAPGVPYSLFSNAEDAQTTSTNPIQINTTTPFFSAKFTDVETGDTATKAHIQVSTVSSFASITHWDSGSSGTSITSCAINARCQNLKYKYFGSAPTLNLSLNDDADENSQTVYYWRLRYFDAQGGAGSYSTSTASFTLLDAPNEPSGALASVITATGATIGWTDNSAIEDNYAVEVDIASANSFAVVSTTLAGVTSMATTTLSPSVQYQYRVKGTNTAGSSAYSTTTAFYTLANAAGAPTTTPASATSLLINLDANNNPVSVTYAIYNVTASQYVAANGTLTSSAVYQTTSTWGADFANTGLTPNTLYQYIAVARNGSGTDSATSTASSGSYTLANIPTEVTGASTAGTNKATISWSANGNPAGTIYRVDGVSNSSLTSGNITNTSYEFTGLVAGATYTFRVRAIGHGGFATAYSDVISVTVPANEGGPPPPQPPPPPEPPPIDPIFPPIDPDLQPSGLLKILSAQSGALDFLSEAGVSGPLVQNANSNANVKSINGGSELVKLQKPFSLDFSFDVKVSPFSTEARGNKELFSKGNDYYFGFFGAANSPAIIDNGLCFVVNNSAAKVCDDSFDQKTFNLNKRFDYTVVWNGQTLNLLEGSKKLASKDVSSISASDSPLVLGGNSYVSNGKTYFASYPSTIYQMKLKADNPISYTNKKEIKLKIESTYAPELALKESDGSSSSDFSNVSFDAAKSEMLWTLAGVDGKKCVNARFRSNLKNFTYDTYACVILDTIDPSATFAVVTGYDDLGAKIGNGRISGISEPEVAVTIFLERFFDTAGASAGEEKSSAILQPSGSMWLAQANPIGELAASVKTQLSVNANQDGTWQYVSASPLAYNARYIISVQTRDLAGNVSKLETKDFVVGKPLSPCDPNKETCPELPCDPTKDECEEPPCDPTKETCSEPPCDPAKEKCEPVIPPDNKPDKPPVDNKPPKDSNNDSGNNSNTGNGAGESGVGAGNGSGQVTSSLNVSEEGLLVNVLNVISGAILSGFNKVRDFINSPLVQAINKKILVPGAAALAMVNAALGFQLPTLINFLKYLFGQPAMILRRRKQKTWGVAYNSYTKEPVDLATIRLIDEATGRVVTSQVTDFHGRYFMSANKGQYKLEVVKPGFRGFSEFLKEKDEDVKFANLYHGAVFYPPRDQFEINYNIPLDPIVANKPVAKIFRDNLWEKIHYGISFAGLAASIMSFVATPRWYTFGFICLHITLFALFYRLAHHKLPPVWGVVREFGTKNPVGRVVVRIFDSAYNKLVNTGVTDSSGRYALLVGPSVYYVSYEKVGYQKKDSPIMDYSSKKTGGMGGIINRDEMIEKVVPGKGISIQEGTETVTAEKSEPAAPKTDLDKVNDDINKWKDSN